MIGRAAWLPTCIEVVPTGVDLSNDHDATPVRKAPGAGAVRIGALSNFVVNVHGEDFKGAAVLADASARLPEGSAKIDVHGAIDPVSRARLEASPNLVLHGPFDSGQLDEILDELDYLVVPSLIENYPTVVREAFARRIPVISSDAGGLPELVTDGVNGIVVAAGDPLALARALTRAQQDAPLLETLRAGIRPPLGMCEGRVALGRPIPTTGRSLPCTENLDAGERGGGDLCPSQLTAPVPGRVRRTKPPAPVIRDHRRRRLSAGPCTGGRRIVQ